MCVGGVGPGSQSFWATFYLKFQFSVLFWLILASVSFRQLPSASVSFRWLPSPHILSNSDDMTGGGGGGGSQSFWATFQLKMQFSVLFWLILASVSFRQLPSASAGFRGLPSPRNAKPRQHEMWAGGPESKVPGSVFSLKCSFQCCYAQF